MSTECVRSITFTIPGDDDSPSIQVMVVEDAGKLNFTATVEESDSMTADLRGVFFNFAELSQNKIEGLSVEGDDVTDFAAEQGEVITLGNDANMRGKGIQPFDVGLEFGTMGIGKDDIQTTQFTLSNEGEDLTLDDIAHVLFGARLTSIGIEGERDGSAKLTATSPAAPTAVDDAYAIYEDGQSGLESPTHIPVGQVFQVLDNDTDADGDTLTITDIHGAAHGTLVIVDGDDADSDAGDAIMYIPDSDYAGEDSFEYCISDGHGGTDFAEVNVAIEAVADIPDLSYEILAGEEINEIIVRVTATQTDADSSEFIDRIMLAGIPDTVTVSPEIVNPVVEPDQVVQDYLLTLPLDQDTDFDLGITAYSKETSNGDEESATVTVPIVMEVNAISEGRVFDAIDQSIWTSGDEFVFDDESFIGIDVDDSGSGGFGPIQASGYYDLKAGFESDLHFEGGDIDAHVPWQFDFGTFYNKTTDNLLIETGSMLTAGGGFQTDGPSLDYLLDFVLEYALGADVDFYFDYGVGAIDENLFSVNLSGDHSTNIIDYHSDTDPGLNLNFWNNALTVTLAWPNLQVNGTETVPASGIYTGDGASNNALNINLDVDQAVANIFFGGVNPFDFSVDLLVVGGTLELLDADVAAGLNFLQDFELTAGNIDANLVFEDGSSMPFIFGADIELENASLIDVGGDGDGFVEAVVDLQLLNSTLENDTDLGFNVGWNLDFIKGSWWYDVGVASGSDNWGPVIDLGEDQIPVFDADIFYDTVGVAFAGESLDLFA